MNTKTTYEVIAEFKGVEIKIPKNTALINGGRTLTEVADHTMIDENGEETTVKKHIHNGMLLDSGAILNRNFFGYSLTDAGKKHLANVKVVKKTVEGREYILLDICKSKAKIKKGKLKFPKNTAPTNGDIPIPQSNWQTIHFEKYEVIPISCSICGKKGKITHPHNEERLGPYKCPDCR